MKKNKVIWLSIPFTMKCYEVSNTGSVRSFNVMGQSGFRLLKGKTVAEGNERRLIDAVIQELELRKSLLVNRLVFFCHYYVPVVLKKKLKDATWDEFLAMPLIVHVDGNVENNHLDNLEAKLTHAEVASWAYKTFPQKFKLPIKTSVIQGDDAILCSKLLKQGISYPEIIKKLSVDMSEMAVQRFNLAHKISPNRPNGKPKLTAEQKASIPALSIKMSRSQIADKFGVCKHTILRAIYGRKTKKT